MRKISLPRECSEKHSKQFYEGSGSGDEDSKASEDDSQLEGPINVESTVSSDK